MSVRAGATAVGVLVVLFAQTAGADEQYAPTTVTAAQLFELNRHAIGSLKPAWYHIVVRKQSRKGDVWTFDTYRNGNDYRTTVRQGNLLEAYGEYHGQAWSQNENGLVTKSTNFFEEADPFNNSMRRPDDPSSGLKLLGLTTGDDPQFVIQITPRDALLQRRFYDAKTDLLTKVELVDYDGRKQIWEYSDYRNVFGLKVAGLVSYEPADAVVASQTTLTGYDRVTTAVDLSIPPSHPLFDLGSSDAVVIPAEFTSDGIFVMVTIGGRGLDFQLDSGSSDFIIDPSVAGELGMQSSGAVRANFAGDFVMAQTLAPSVTIGSLSAKNVALSTVAFQEQLEDRRIVGLLGGDFIASGVLEVNFEKKSLTMMRSLPGDLAAKGWSVLPLRLDDNVPMLKAAFSGRQGWFVADLGADRSTLFPHYFAQFPIKVPRGTRDQGEMASIANDPFGIKYFTMNNLVLGDRAFSDVQVVVPSSRSAQERDYDGLIGRDLLSNFNLIFDYADRQLWLRPIDLAN